ncbi:MAG: hypothetical protein ACE3JU_11535 [Paenibacillus sp.]|uniref:hypothetical protein n=1 Tax=Paenibacillus sp. TaxID=58172 RepID=UPI003B7EA86C
MVERIMHPTGGKAFRSLKDSERVFKNDSKPFALFDNHYDFKVGKFLLRGGASDTFINRGFNSSVLHRYDIDGVQEMKISFAYPLKKKVNKLAPELGECSWKFGEAVF